MRIPQAIKKIFGFFHQDILLLETTLDGIVNYGIRWLSSSESAEAKLFLNTLLDGSYSIVQIREVWGSIRKDIRIDDDQQMITFLKHIRDSLPTA